METRAYLIHQQSGQEIVVSKDTRRSIAIEGEAAERLLSDIPILSAITSIVSAVEMLQEYGYAFHGACGKSIKNARV